MEKQSYVNHKTCNVCLFCGDVCPNLLLSKSEDKKVIFHPQFDKLCISCGHCMAICPTNSIHIKNLEYDKDIYHINKETDQNELFNLMKTRRAVRQYKSKEVPRELLEKIAQGIALAPVSFPPNNMEISIVNSSQILAESLDIITESYFKLQKMMKNPIIRMIIKKNAGKDYQTLKNYILPMLSSKTKKIRDKEIDPIFRGAPVLIVIHGGETALNKEEDGLIAMTYGFLTAEHLGLSTCPVSLIPPIINTENKLKDKLHIPLENKAIASFIVGYGKFKYKKAINREMKNIYYV